MNIHLMRWLDFWLGIPMCFLLCLHRKVTRLFWVGNKNPYVKNILFIKLSELGAMVLAYPLIKQTREKFPNADFYFLTFNENKDIFNFFDDSTRPTKVLTIRTGSILHLICDSFKIISFLRNENIDIAFDLELFSRFTAILAYLFKAKKRIGFYPYAFKGLYRGDLFTHNISYNPLIHISSSYVALLSATDVASKITPDTEICIDIGDLKHLSYISPENLKQEIFSKLKNFGVKERNRLLLVNPGENRLPLRNWPEENFVLLCRWLLEDAMNFIIFIGDSKDNKKTKFIGSQLNNKRFLDYTDKTSLAELIGLFNIATILISNDCGLAHLASLTPIKKFILFGPESPQIYGPLGDNTQIIYSNVACSPCFSALNHRNSFCRNNKCLKSISPKKLYELINNYI